MKNLSDLYDANFKKIRGKASQGLIRPTLSQYFMSHKDFTEIASSFNVTNIRDERIANYNTTYYPSYQIISETTALVCYSNNDSGREGTAFILDWSSGNNIITTQTVFEQNDTYYISVSLINNTSAIVCYVDGWNFNKTGKACILNWSTGTITHNNTTIFRNTCYEIPIISCSVINSTSAIVCYWDKPTGTTNYGESKILDWSSGTVSIKDSKSIWGSGPGNIQCKSINESLAIAILRSPSTQGYRGNAMMINTSGGNISVGDIEVFNNDNSSDFSFDNINETTGIVCYRSNDTDTCLASFLDWTSGNIYDQTEVEFSTNRGEGFSCKILTPTKAVVVFKDTSDSYSGKICVLDFSSGSIVSEEVTKFSDYVGSVSIQKINDKSIIVFYTDTNSQCISRIIG